MLYYFKFMNLQEYQKYNLNQKIDKSFCAIEQFYNAMNGNVYISFSGGKDSTVLLFLVRKLYPNAIAVFSDTGLEFPEIRDFVKTIENVVWLKPKYTFRNVIEKYGIPYPSKEVARTIYQIKNTKSEKLRNKLLNGDEKGNMRKLPIKWKHLLGSDYNVNSSCCYHLKKAPFKAFEVKSKLHPFTGTMAVESQLRKTNYNLHGCNNLDSKHPISNPLSFWTEKDIWDFLKINNIPYSKIYDMGYERTGCMFCLFGISYERSNLFEKNRLQKLHETHPKQWSFVINKLNFKNLLNKERINYI